MMPLSDAHRGRLPKWLSKDGRQSPRLEAMA